MSFARLKLTLAEDSPLGSQFERNVPGSVAFFKCVEACKAGATAAERRTPISWGG